MTSDGIDKPTDKRPNYFAGQYLLEDDFQAEQQYHIDRQRWHHHLLHISGIADGLKVTKGGDLAVNVSEGSAIDPQGRQIILLNLKKQDLKEIFIPKNTTVSDGTYTLYIGHSERKTDQQTLGEGNEITSRRWQEEPEFRLSSSEVKDFIPLAKLTIDNGVVVVSDKIYNSVRVYSGLRLPSFDGEITLRSQSDGSKSVAELKGSLSITDTLSVTGNVGIGTTSPKIHLAIGDDSTGLNQQGNGQLAIYTNLHERVRIDANGSVGIGTATPGAKLEISNGNLKVGGNISATAVNFHPNFGQKLTLGSSDYGIGLQADTQYFRTFQNFAWYKGGSHNDALLNPGGGSVQMVIKDGNVGIGTTTPTAKLEVSGGDLKVGGNISATNAALTGNVGIGTTEPGASKLKISNSTSDFVDISFASGANGMGQLQILGSPSGWNINTITPRKHLYLNRDSDATSNVYIGCNGKELFVRGKDGNVGIGTTSPEAKLQVGDKITHYKDYDFTKTTLLVKSQSPNTKTSDYDAFFLSEPESVLTLVREGLRGYASGSTAAWGNMADFRLSRYGDASDVDTTDTNSNTQLDIHLTKGAFDSLHSVMTLRANGRILRNGQDFSKSGSVSDQEDVKVPWGTIADWNIFVAPRYGGIEEPQSEYDNAVIAINCYASELGDNTGWKVTIKFKVRWWATADTLPGGDIRNGEWQGQNGTNKFSANYILIPR